MLSFWKSPKPNKSSLDDFLTTSGSAQSGQDRVTYASRDRKKDVEFVCHLPTGSRHAADAQLIAGHIYTDTSPPMGWLRSGTATDQQLLENGGKGRHDTSPTCHEKTKSKQQKQQQSSRHSQVAKTYSGYVDDEDENDNENDSNIDPNDSISSVGRHAPSRHRAAPKAEAAIRGSGFRKQSATHTTHYLEGDERQLFVSAPNGSQEARLFDEVSAKANVAKDKASRRRGIM